MISIDTTELKPCPFCGREPRTNISWCGIYGSRDIVLTFSVKCDYCHISRDCVKEVHSTSFDECIEMMNRAIEMWNERA